MVPKLLAGATGPQEAAENGVQSLGAWQIRRTAINQHVGTPAASLWWAENIDGGSMSTEAPRPQAATGIAALCELADAILNFFYQVMTSPRCEDGDALRELEQELKGHAFWSEWPCKPALLWCAASAVNQALKVCREHGHPQLPPDAVEKLGLHTLAMTIWKDIQSERRELLTKVDAARPPAIEDCREQGPLYVESFHRIDALAMALRKLWSVTTVDEWRREWVVVDEALVRARDFVRSEKQSTDPPEKAVDSQGTKRKRIRKGEPAFYKPEFFQEVVDAVEGRSNGKTAYDALKGFLEQHDGAITRDLNTYEGDTKEAIAKRYLDTARESVRRAGEDIARTNAGTKSRGRQRHANRGKARRL